MVKHDIISFKSGGIILCKQIHDLGKKFYVFLVALGTLSVLEWLKMY